MEKTKRFEHLILGHTYNKLYENGHKKMKRKDVFNIICSNVKIDKSIAKLILRDLEKIGLIESKKRGIVLIKKKLRRGAI